MKYLKELEAKMEQLRASLIQHELDQREQEVVHKQEKQLNLISKLAGKRHHLLGTISNPGVYALPPRDQRPPTEQALQLQHTILKIPESQIRSNSVIKQWIADNIKNSYKFLKKKHYQVHDSAENNEKVVQGPFLVCILYIYISQNIICIKRFNYHLNRRCVYKPIITILKITKEKKKDKKFYKDALKSTFQRPVYAIPQKITF